jgi:hypothetical protein
MFLPNDWSDLLRQFNAAGVKYLVIGAAAMAVHGEIRGTDDFDVWVQASRDNAERVLRALTSFGAPVASLTLEELQSDDLIFQIGVKPLRIDILTGIDGVHFDDAWPNRIVAKDSDLEYPIISREDLIRNKRAVGRDKDLVDVSILEKAAEMQDSEKSLPDDVSAALAAYRKEKTAARWTALSQLWVGEVQVLDALKLAVPDFPDPLPLPVDGLLDDSSEFFEWSALPDPDDVRRGLRIALSLP